MAVEWHTSFTFWLLGSYHVTMKPKSIYSFSQVVFFSGCYSTAWTMIVLKTFWPIAGPTLAVPRFKRPRTAAPEAAKRPVTGVGHKKFRGVLRLL